MSELCSFVAIFAYCKVFMRKHEHFLYIGQRYAIKLKRNYSKIYNSNSIKCLNTERIFFSKKVIKSQFKMLMSCRSLMEWFTSPCSAMTFIGFTPIRNIFIIKSSFFVCLLFHKFDRRKKNSHHIPRGAVAATSISLPIIHNPCKVALI